MGLSPRKIHGKAVTQVLDNKTDASADGKLTPIIEAADDLAWLIAGSMKKLRSAPDREEGINISKADAAVYKEFTSTLKNLTAIIRDVNDIPGTAAVDDGSAVTFVLSDEAEEFSK